MCRYPILLALGALPLAVGAQQQDALVLSVSQSVAHDTNLLRLPAGADPATLTGVADRSDTILRTTAGVTFDREISRQRVRASAAVNADRFANHRQFDFNGYQAAGVWDWAAGARWYGDATLRADQRLASFVDVRGGQKNIIDQHFARLGAGYRLTPRWSAVAAAEALQVQHSAAAFAAAEFRDVSAEAGARFAPNTSADWSLLWRHGEGRFTADAARSAPIGQTGLAGDRGYSDDRLLMLMSVAPNEISRLSGNIGYTWRRYDSSTRGDFRGLTYALEYVWRRGDALSISAYLRRDVGVGAILATGSPALAEISTAQVLTANYTDARYVGLRPTWQLTAKLRLNGQLEYVDRQFGADSAPAVLGGAERRDRLRAVGASVDYEVLRKAVLTGFVRHEHRSSSQAQFDFSARVVGAALEIRF